MVTVDMSDSAKSPPPNPALRRSVPAKRKAMADRLNNQVHQACSTCKARKARCDSRRPRCSFCEGRNQDCVYPPLYKRAVCSQFHVDNLEAKVQELEAQLNTQPEAIAKDPQGSIASPLNSSHSRSNGPQPFLAQVQGDDATTEIDGGHKDCSPVAPEPIAPISTFTTCENDTGARETAEEVPATDGMVEYSMSPPQGKDTDGFYSDSYSLRFAMHVKASTMPLRMSVSTVGHTFQPRQGVLEVNASSSTGSWDDEDDLATLRSYLAVPSFQGLPHRHVAKQLLEAYFTNVHPIWPFLIEEDTLAQFDNMYTSDTPIKPVAMAMMNLIFALGCQFCRNITPGGDLVSAMGSGTSFYRCARAFIVAHTYNTCSISMLQTLLLMAQYQQGTMRGKQCWLTIGHATRIAQCLNLHLDSRDCSQAPLDRELGRRLWWGCFSLDRVASMIYGRQPTLLHPRFSNPPLPRLVDDIYIRDSKTQPDRIPSVNAFIHYTVRLYLVMDKITEELQPFRRQSDTSVEPETQRNVLQSLIDLVEADEHLVSWHASLPDYFRFSLDSTEQQVSPQPWWVQRCKIVLKNRFLGLRILLHRQTILFLLGPCQPMESARYPSYHWPPLFSDLIHGLAANGTVVRPQSSFESVLAYLSAQICVRSAQQQIEEISVNRPANLTGAWWWDFHFNFDSLCVLLGAVGLPTEHRAAIILDVAVIHETIRKGLETIHSLVPFGGDKLQQSEHFLQQLHRVAYEQEPVRPHEKGPTNSNGDSEDQEMLLSTLVSARNRDTSLDHMGVGNGIGLEAWGPVNAPPSSGIQDTTGNLNTNQMEELGGFSTETMGSLLQSSFTFWNAFDYDTITSRGQELGAERLVNFQPGWA
ncbi:hypothetical protein N7510_002711 [Penicillium lagena]|uniref:uncharacterized protein n=1 Tax=Penicillium lagena TaxID=94218 RepID=UPI00254235C6|nr:uncharacterized protein N7510_002711 [Penicillium lagena]KAJ5626402.1 hypothetical protein N7510_002711 [Penicillium lagena]